MTMYYISEFCRICLQYDKNLIDIVKIENEPTETLLNKLKLCVSEVEWTSSSILLCQSCIRKLHGYYDFKKQCLISAQTWKRYLELLNESQQKLSSQVSVTVAKKDIKQEPVDSDDEKLKARDKQNAFFQVAPNQKFLKLFVGPQQPQNSFQNVFLNLIPANTTKQPLDPKVNHFVVQNQGLKESSRNVFLNLNNTFQKFIPVAENKRGPKPTQDLNVSRILTQAKTEELSVEIDPTDFGCISDDSPAGEVPEKDWEDLISGTKIHTDVNVPRLVPLKKGQENGFSATSRTSNYVPILPKPKPYDVTNEEKYEFFNGGHFLTFKDEAPPVSEFNYPCELCGKSFDSVKILRYHIKQFHMGKFPYKCDFCYSEFANRQMYDAHMEKHKEESNIFITKDTLTLQDFPEVELQVPEPQALTTAVAATQKEEVSQPQPQHTCDVCQSSFFSANGLLRHKARKHKQKNKKKYFIKGMKNARCDICNRDFSTQSYLQLHKKLHLRNGPGYRGKVFRNKYGNRTSMTSTKNEQNGEKVEEIEQKMETEENKCEEEPSADESIDFNGDDVEMQEDESKPEQDAEIKDSDNEENLEEEKEDTSANVSTGLKIKINLKSLKSASRDVEDTHSSEEEQQIRTNNEADDDIECSMKLTSINEAPYADICNQKKTKYFCYLEIKDSESLKNLDILKTPSITKKCYYCIRTFRRKTDLKRHLNNYHLKSVHYKCHLCSNTFIEIAHLTKHLQLHFTSASCSICQKMFSTEKDMQEHNDTHEDCAFWQCGVCYTLFGDTKSLKQHMDSHDQKISYNCSFCNEGFTDLGNFSKHVVEHNGLYTCTKCDLTFKHENEKCAHDIEIHKVNSFKCSLCQNSYAKQHELTRHLNIHEKHPLLLETNENNDYKDHEYSE